MKIAPHARIHIRPTAFVDSPFGLDGRVQRLAGGLLFFSGYELTASEGGRRTAQAIVGVDAIDALLATLSSTQAEAARAVIDRILAPRPALHLGDRILRFDQPHVMAILNVTPDSFSDGGRHVGDDAAVAAAGFDMAQAGAAIIDVGGESTRPGAQTVWEGDEIARTEGVVRRLAAGGAIVSIDSRKAAVMAARAAPARDPRAYRQRCFGAHL